jgi:hypothetical protein
MGQVQTELPIKIYRGTVDEVFSHRDEIPYGATVELKIFELTQAEDDPTIALLQSWIAAAPTEPEAIKEAEEDLREFNSNLNKPRKEAGARLLYPEAE